MAKQKRVAVLYGGFSSEREVSLSSGKACIEAIDRLGYISLPVDVSKNIAQDLLAIDADVALNALHGPFGEDGKIQGLLELLEIPYTHSGVLASALAMDKERTKIAYKEAGIPIAESKLVSASEVRAAHPMKAPYVVKPYNEGSSVGVYIVHDEKDGPAQLSEDMPDELMVEKYIPGRELTVGVMGDRALCVTEIISEGWYDFNAKYSQGGSRHVLPADLPKEVTDACLKYAQRAHKVLGCRGMTRTDFRFDEAAGIDGLFALETNTQPGMTPTSLAPEQAAFVGMDFEELVHWLIEDASCLR